MILVGMVMMILVGMLMLMIILVDILTQPKLLMMGMGLQLLYLPVILTLAMLLLMLIQALLLLMVMEPLLLLEQKGSIQHLELLKMTMELLGNIRGTRMAFILHLGKTGKVLD